MMVNLGKTHTPKFEGEDIWVGFTEIDNWASKLSSRYSDVFSYLRNYN